MAQKKRGGLKAVYRCWVRGRIDIIWSLRMPPPVRSNENERINQPNRNKMHRTFSFVQWMYNSTTAFLLALYPHIASHMILYTFIAQVEKSCWWYGVFGWLPFARFGSFSFLLFFRKFERRCYTRCGSVIVWADFSPCSINDGVLYGHFFRIIFRHAIPRPSFVEHVGKSAVTKRIESFLFVLFVWNVAFVVVLLRDWPKVSQKTLELLFSNYRDGTPEVSKFSEEE